MEKTAVKPRESIPYFKDATVTCNCGAIYTLGSTIKELKVEICANCHPFFTGTEKFIDSAGRLERFKAKVEAAKKHQAAKAARSVNRKKEKEKETNDVKTANS